MPFRYSGGAFYYLMAGIITTAQARRNAEIIIYLNYVDKMTAAHRYCHAFTGIRILRWDYTSMTCCDIIALLARKKHTDACPRYQHAEYIAIYFDNYRYNAGGEYRNGCGAISRDAVCTSRLCIFSLTAQADMCLVASRHAILLPIHVLVRFARFIAATLRNAADTSLQLHNILRVYY